MELTKISEAFGKSYLDFKEANKFQNKTKLYSAYWNRQRPRRYYDFPNENLIENEDSKTFINVPKINIIPDVTLQQAINNRRTYTFNDFKYDWTKEELYTFLNLSSGITGEKEYFSFNSQKEKVYHIHKLRAYPSGGGLYPIEMYMYIKGISGIEEGLYLFNPTKSRLIKIDNKKNINELETLLPMTAVKIDPLNSSLDKTNIIMFLVSNYKYSSYKYGLLAYKLAILEAGHLGQNIQLAATALNKKTIALCGYYDDKVEKFLKIDGQERVCLYAFTLG